MIITENMIIDNKEYVKTYSDQNVYLERDGSLYSEAIDPIEFDRKYIETNHLIILEF